MEIELGGIRMINRNIIPLLLIADLLIPFLLAPTYKGYNHLKKVMSVLGNPQAPFHLVYSTWLVVFGIGLLVNIAPIYYTIAKTSKVVSKLFLFIIIAYSIGGCILSGFFPVEESKSLKSISAKIHGIGSVIGFLLLIFAPLLVAIYFLMLNNIGLGISSLICFLLAIGFFVLFVLADKP